MENCRTNEVLAQQIAIITEYAAKLDTLDLGLLDANADVIATALNTLKDELKYLPK